VDIFYDYAGVENWATKRWQAKNEFTQAYAAFVRESGIRVYWHKVKSHSGDYWNDRADELAKQGTD
jgi:ribonuclease HI